MKDNIIEKITMCILGFIFAIAIVFAQNDTQSTQDNSGWIEHSLHWLASDTEVTIQDTKYSIPKYYIEAEDVYIYIEEDTYYKFINKEVDLVVVEWYHPQKDLYKYTIRPLKQRVSKPINFDSLLDE